MSKVVITIQDDGDTVDVHLDFEPALNTNETPTGAQYLALKMIEAANRENQRVDEDYE